MCFPKGCLMTRPVDSATMCSLIHWQRGMLLRLLASWCSYGCWCCCCWLRLRRDDSRSFRGQIYPIELSFVTQFSSPTLAIFWSHLKNFSPCLFFFLIQMFIQSIYSYLLYSYFCTFAMHWTLDMTKKKIIEWKITITK